MKILFVCLGNICRSPLAEEVMRSIAPSDWTIDSAGTGDYHIGDLPYPLMRKVAAQRGYKLTHHCRQVCQKDFEIFDIIVGMDDANIRNLKRIAPARYQSKIVAIADYFNPGTPNKCVPDPYYEDEPCYHLNVDLLEEACPNLLKSLRS